MAFGAVNGCAVWRPCCYFLSPGGCVLPVLPCLPCASFRGTCAGAAWTANAVCGSTCWVPHTAARISAAVGALVYRGFATRVYASTICFTYLLTDMNKGRVLRLCFPALTSGSRRSETVRLLQYGRLLAPSRATADSVSRLYLTVREELGSAF